MVDVKKVIEYETGEMTVGETLQFFADLIKSGECWKLQGHYGRTAQALIDSGFITADGNLNTQGRAVIAKEHLDFA